MPTPVDEARRLIENGQPQKAIEILRPYLEQNGDDIHGWSALAAAHFGLEQWGEARNAAVRTIELDPDNPRYWSNLGTIDRKAGYLKSASEAQRRALELDPLSEQANTELRKLRKLRTTRQPAATRLWALGIGLVVVVLIVVMLIIAGRASKLGEDLREPVTLGAILPVLSGDQLVAIRGQVTSFSSGRAFGHLTLRPEKSSASDIGEVEVLLDGSAPTVGIGEDVVVVGELRVDLYGTPIGSPTYELSNAHIGSAAQGQEIAPPAVFQALVSVVSRGRPVSCTGEVQGATTLSVPDVGDTPCIDLLCWPYGASEPIEVNVFLEDGLPRGLAKGMRVTAVGDVTWLISNPVVGLALHRARLE